ELDRQRRELRLSSTPPCTPGPRNLRWLVHPLVELEVEGEPAIFMLDTGSDTTELAAAGRLGARARGAPRQAWTTHGAGGSESTSLPVVAELRLAVDDWAITLEHVPVRDLPALGFGQIDGRLGQDAWAGATLQICGSTARPLTPLRAPRPALPAGHPQQAHLPLHPRLQVQAPAELLHRQVVLVALGVVQDHHPARPHDPKGLVQAVGARAAVHQRHVEGP